MSVNSVTNGLSQLSVGSGQAGRDDDPRFARFASLEHAPADHHYNNQVLGPKGSQWSVSVKREHGILASSLPPNMLVRVYEDRLDLVRCLIIGPLGTPFAQAPFLFDIRLPPASFPQSPPLVFFHSGSTRISPNLYDNGTVCLSLLATWPAGHACETWRAGHSSVLQLLVSIQGLILVRQPYFTEPGYERSKGIAQGEILSAAYDENTFTLTRAFVTRACANPHPSFADEIAAFYINGLRPGRAPVLKAVIDQIRALVAESERHAARGSTGGTGGAGGRQQSTIVGELQVLSPAASATLRGTLVGLEAVAKGKGKAW